NPFNAGDGPKGPPLEVDRLTESARATVRASRASVVRLMVPTDANFTGNVFGGAILAEIDRVAYITATRHAKATCVTASFDRVDFVAPVHVGEVVDFDAALTYVGRSSMEVWIQVRAEALQGGGSSLVAVAFVTMVAVDPSGQPLAVPPLVLETEEERTRFEEGRRRMEERRRLRGRTAPK
ncbi:MAG: acyl-CoA thioesterase, partial [Thermoplasmata archaeon]|nr:acyl-CoA thioesterase [Thermoplasmata archaeon]